MSFPNFFTTPRAYNEVEIGGRMVLAILREVDGIKVEAEWTEQKSTGTSGATMTYKGMKPAGPHKLTFECADAPHATAAEMEADMRGHYEAMLPKPGLTGGAAAATTKDPNAPKPTKENPAPAATAEQLLADAQKQLAKLNAPPGAAAADAAGGAGSSTAKAAASTGANPGPKPPTLSVRNGFVNYHGTTAISLKSFEGPKPTATNSTRYVLEVVAQKAVTPAGTGVAPAKSKDAVGTGGAANASGGGAAGSAAAAAGTSAAAGAGT